jgi:multidrug efflux system outer membrane protein
MRLRRFSVSGAGRAGARRFARVVGLCLLQALGGCILHTEKPDPALDIPGSYVAAKKGPASALPALDWWRGFGSRELTLLMEEAQTANLDIAVAVARILQADAQVRIANAALLPVLDPWAASAAAVAAGLR